MIAKLLFIRFIFNYAAVRLCEVSNKLEGVPFNICVTISPAPTEDITVNLRSNSTGMLKQ